MPEPVEGSSKIEIAHVLTLDVVEYSTLLITEQTRLIGELTGMVRSAPRFRQAEKEEKVLPVPTGDGMLLVFFDDPQAPIECAMEIARTIKNHARIRVRMGIHSGPVRELVDVNDRKNVAGAGVDTAQRVMDCGDAGHILLSKRIADDLAPFPRWNPHLHELGECEIKHGRKLSLVNFYTDEVGNPEPPEKCASRSEQEPSRIGASDKSIAVLPFENLSPDPENAYFAAGIQEEILTRLCKIGDLKVVSRTSTQLYKTATTNLREIAAQLGVTNVVEGSVRKAGDHVRVHVQLINARTDSHLWGERYDRELTDIFAVETEIAQSIAEALEANLTGAEQRAVSKRPTANPEAHQLYLKGLFYWNKFLAPNFEKSRSYFEQAIGLDPDYAVAHAGLAVFYAFAGANGLMSPEDAWPQTEREVNLAWKLDSTMAETYNPLAAIKLYRDRDWPGAEQTFQEAIELNPKFAEIYQHYALCLGLFNRHQDALEAIERSLAFEPLSPRFNVNYARLLFVRRDYEAALEQYLTTIELDSNYALAHEWLGYVYEKLGRKDEAIQEGARALILSGAPEEASELQNACAKIGFDAALAELARKRIEKCDARRASGHFVSSAEYAMAWMRIGDFERSFRALEETCTERSRIPLEVRVDPRFDPLRRDPRFDRLMDELMPTNPR
jgi:TolB-like protein/Tfp pilus assembly protein PilF